MNREVSVTKRVRTARGLRYSPVVISANGRIKPDAVYIDGKEERHPEGSYYLSWYAGKRLMRESVGKDAATATARRQQKEAELNARNNGIAILPEAYRRPLSVAVAEYLEETKLAKKPKTLAAYTTALNYFVESCPKEYVEDIERKDLLRFSSFLRDKKQAPRSCWNKFANVMSFLKANGVRGLVKKNDWPRYTEEEPEVYEDEELEKLFAECDDEERLWFEFFLLTGMREQEVIHCSWRDVNFVAETVRVTHKPDLNWTPKAYKEREIPLADKLAAALKAWKRKAKDGLVFQTREGGLKLDFLDCLKAVARRAKLKENDFWLHKFRATFATRCLWEGVDLRTVQQWLGHSDMESTMRYLKPARNSSVRLKLNGILKGKPYGHNSGQKQASTDVTSESHQRDSSRTDG